MSRSFTPPSTLSKEDQQTIAMVRRDIWVHAFSGLLIGTVSGFGVHVTASLGHRYGLWKLPQLNKNTALFSVLVGGAIGSFINATTTGKNEVWRLHPIFQIGAEPPPPPIMDYSKDNNSPYQKSLEEMRLKELEMQILESRSDRTASEQEYLERAYREKNRLYRRATLNDSMSHHGLSDAHGGQWAEENDETTKITQKK